MVKKNDSSDYITVPENLICNENIITSVFGEVINQQNIKAISKFAILAPTNFYVDKINEETLERITIQRNTDECTYKSVDVSLSNGTQEALSFTTEFLNSLNPTGLSKHELRLKNWAIVMLLRNFDINQGLCNGTRLRIESLGKFILTCSFIDEQKRDLNQAVIIPRIDLYWDCCEFRLRRRQFPICLAFGMTINKSQGQTFSKIGL